MKKKILCVSIIFTLIQIPVVVFSQCTPVIPNNANVVSFSQTVNGGFTPQWVCSGDTLFSGGGIFFVYLETGAVMNTGGGIDTLYMKDGSVLDMNGGIHVIYHEPAAILNVAGGIPTYIPCSTITFDYSNAPSNGCLITTSVSEENVGSMSVSVSPNPVMNQLSVTCNHLSEKSVIEIYDVLGQFQTSLEILGHNFQSASIDVSSLVSGIYFVNVKTDTEISTTKFVKE